MKKTLLLCIFAGMVSAIAFLLNNSPNTAACVFNPDAGCYIFENLYNVGAALESDVPGVAAALDAYSGADQCGEGCTFTSETITVTWSTNGEYQNSGYNPDTGKFETYDKYSVANNTGPASHETRTYTREDGAVVTIESWYKEPCHNPLRREINETPPPPPPPPPPIPEKADCDCVENKEKPVTPPKPANVDRPTPLSSAGDTFAQAYVKSAGTGAEKITGGSSIGIGVNTRPDSLIVANPDMVSSMNGSSDTVVYAKPHDQVQINVSAKAAHIGCYYSLYYAQSGQNCPTSSAFVSNDLGNSSAPRTTETKGPVTDGSRISIIHGYRSVTAEDVGRIFSGSAEATPTHMAVYWNTPIWEQYIAGWSPEIASENCRYVCGNSCSGTNEWGQCDSWTDNYCDNWCAYIADWHEIYGQYIKDWQGQHTASGSSSKKVRIEIPYNYDVEIPPLTPCNTDGNPPCAEWPNYGITYAGEDRKFDFSVNTNPVNDSNFDQPVATNTRPSTYEIISFVTTEGSGMPTGREDSAFHGGNGAVYSSAPPAGSSCGYYTAGTSRVRDCVVVQQRQNIWFNTNTNGAPNNVNTNGNTDTSVYTLDGTRLESIQPSVVIDDLPAGSKFCIALSVWPNDVYHGLGDSSASSWLHGAPHCLTIAKKPSTQFWGAGVFSAGDITTSQSVKYVPDANGFTASGSHNGLSTNNTDRRAFGSWSEYEAISNRNIKGLATGAALGYNPLGTSTIGGNFNSTRPAGFPTSYDASNTFSSSRICNYSSQTFANSNNNTECQANSTTMGNSNILSNIDLTLDRLISRYATTSDNPTTDITIGIGGDAPQSTSDDKNTQSYNSNAANVTLRTNSTIPAGNTITVTVPGKLTIASNIEYPNANYTNIADLPQVLIFADSIDILPSVSRVDAWLVVGQHSTSSTPSPDSGVLNTCAGFNVGTSSINSCDAHPLDDRGVPDKKVPGLTINGPVFTEKLALNRTAGANAGHDSITPAERFNLRADTYLWSYAQAQRYSQAVVTYSRELAPRY